MTTRISIIGGSVTGNRGAEAMLIATIGRIRDRVSDARFYVYTCNPSQDRRVLNDATVALHSSQPLGLLFWLTPLSCLLALLKFFRLGFAARFFPAAVRDLEASDALIDIAGVAFIDGREKYLPYNILTLFPALVLQVPVFKFSQAMGPFNNHVNRLSARMVLGSCRRVYARGAQTRAHLQSLGLRDGIVAEASDIAFLLRPEDALSRENPDHLDALLEALDRFHDGRPLVGICPSAVVAAKFAALGRDYIGFLAELVTGCLDNGLRVFLFSNSMREHYPQKRKNNDLPFIFETVERLRRHRPEALADLVSMTHDLNAGAVAGLIARCDLTLVSRFHAMVASLAAGVPTLVLGWSHKYIEVMRQFGQQDWVLDYTAPECGCITVRLLEIIARREELGDEIRRRLCAVMASAEDQVRDFVLSLNMPSD